MRRRWTCATAGGSQRSRGWLTPREPSRPSSTPPAIRRQGPAAATSSLSYLVGTAHVIDRFLDVASPGTSLVCVASMSGYKTRLDPALESQGCNHPNRPAVRHKPIRSRTLQIPASPDTALPRGGFSSVLRPPPWPGRQGSAGPTLSLSPGIICTPMSRDGSPGNAATTCSIVAVPCRAGEWALLEDIAAAIEFRARPAISLATDRSSTAELPPHAAVSPDLQAERSRYDIGPISQGGGVVVGLRFGPGRTY